VFLVLGSLDVSHQLIDYLQQCIPFSRIDHDVLSERLGVEIVDLKCGPTAQDFVVPLIEALKRPEDDLARRVVAIEGQVDIHDFEPMQRTLGLIESSVNTKVRNLVTHWATS
jgi:hypothetical protein